MIFLDSGTDEEDYKRINWTILHVDVMNMYLIIMEGNRVILVLVILHVMVNVLSNFLRLNLPFNHTWLLIVKLFLPVKWYVKELIPFQSISILVHVFYKNNPITYFFSLENNQWQYQHNMLWFEGYCSTLFTVYITKLSQYTSPPTYPNERSW